MPESEDPNQPDPDGAKPKDPEPPADLGDAGKRAIAAERERAKAEKARADAAEARLRELEDKDKSETQRAQDAAAEAVKRAEAAEARAMRLEVANAKGLTMAQANRLVGSTPEELAADADELLAQFSPKETQGDDEGRRPRERLRPGNVPDAEDEPDVDAAVAATRRF